MNLQSALCAACVVNEAQLSESVHEEADTRAGSADHFGQRFLADLRHDGFWDAFFAEVSEQ